MSNSVVLTVVALPVNQPPVIAGLPDQTLNEDTSRDNAFNLNDFSSDPDNVDSQLNYVLAVTTSNQCGVVVDSGKNVDLTPQNNFNGFCDVTVTVRDPSGLSSSDVFRVIVVPVNDNPNFDPLANPIPDQTWTQGTSRNNAFDLDNFFVDVDGDVLTYTASAADNPNITVVIGSGNVVSFTQAASFFGVERVVFTARDGLGGSAQSNSVVLTVVRQVFQCNDGIDNDGDTRIDYPADPGCSSPIDDDESDGPIICYVNNDCGSISSSNSCNVNNGFVTTTTTPTCRNGGTDSSFCENVVSTTIDQCSFICSPVQGCDYTQCSDSQDNDQDGAVDFPNDFSCSSYFDDDELLPRAQCQDSIDNDGDLFVDYPDDPGCFSLQDNDEGPFNPGRTQCSDGLDNDGDTLIDYPADPGCTSTADDDESNTFDLLIDNGFLQNSPITINQNAIVQFNTHKIPANAGIPTNLPVRVTLDSNVITSIPTLPFPSASFMTSVNLGHLSAGTHFFAIQVDPNNVYHETNEANNLFTFQFQVAAIPQCSDGLDNDNDGAIDYPADFGCTSPRDDDETNNGNTQCSDGIDNDADIAIDQDDPQCDDRNDNDENGPPTISLADVTLQDIQGLVVLHDLNAESFDPDDTELSFAITSSGIPECHFEINAQEELLFTATIPQGQSITCGVTVQVRDPHGATGQDSMAVHLTQTAAQCSDNIDNDGDGWIDYPADWGCTSPTDDDETNNGPTQCTDGLDNDGDGLIDRNDPGCTTPGDDDENEAPIITNLPDRILNEDTQLLNTFNLNDFASDHEDPDSTLIYTISVSNSNFCGVSIDALDNIDITPAANFHGVCDATVIVHDSQGLTGSDIFRVSVVPVNDNPNFDPNANPIPAQTWNQGTSRNNAFDLDNYFSDVDGDVLTYTASTADNPNITVVIGSGNVVSFNQPASFHGVEHVVFTANDGRGGSAQSNSVTLTVTQTTFACSDGIDNDGDGWIDYPADWGCTSPTDDDETNNGPTQCTDGLDNDGDGLIDRNDPLCTDPGDDSEYGQCNDHVDNDADGATDYPADFSCSHVNDDDELLPRAQCQDSIDNDGDLFVDSPDDPGCFSLQDNDEGPFNPGRTQCSDTLDNDNDGVIDMQDPGCSSPMDDDESDGTTQCQDGIDNDGDGWIDYPADWGCTSRIDNDETNNGPTQCTDGLDNDGDGLIDRNDPGCTTPGDDDEDEPAVWQTLTDKSVPEDSPSGTLVYGGLKLLCTDPDDTEAVNVVSAHTHYSLNFTGNDLVINSLEHDFTGTENVQLSCNNISAQFSLTITPVNDGPVWSTLPDQTLTEDTVRNDAFSLLNYVTDADDPDASLTFNLVSVTHNNLCGIILDPSKNIDITPVSNFNGVCEATVRATDSTGLFSEASFVVTITPVADAPVVSDIPDQFLDEDQEVSLDLNSYVTDEDNSDDEIAWTTQRLSGTGEISITIDSQNIAHIRGAQDFNGAEAFRFIATDPDGLSDYDDATITIQSIADGARFISTPIGVAFVGEVYMYDANAIDPDGGHITYSLVAAPLGMTIDSDSGIVLWVPTESQIGQNPVTIRAMSENMVTDQEYAIRTRYSFDDTYSQRKVEVGSIVFIEGDTVDAGESVPVAISFGNEGYIKMNDVHVTMVIPELGVYRKIGPFDVSSGKVVTRTLSLNVPEYAPPGVYDVRFVISDDFIRRVKHRELIVS